MAMTDEQLEAFGEQVTIITERLGEMSNALNSIVASQSQIAKSAADAKAKTDALADSAEKSGRALENKAKIEQEVAEKARKREDAMNVAQSHAINALGGFGDALISSERSFSKYNSVIANSTDSLSSLLAILGPVGKGLALLTKLIGVVAQGAANQADSLVKATDELKNMGAIGAFTSEEFLDLANNAGVASSNFGILIKPLQNLGSGLMSIGSTAGKGAEEFLKITEILPETRMQFRRLGVDQEQLIESQANYLALQQATGREILSNNRTTDQLQKASLAYTKNLLELEALTGKSAEQLQKEMNAALAREEYMVQNALIQQEINHLTREGATEGERQRAEGLQRELEVRDKFVTEVSSRIGSKDIDTAIMQMISSGGAIFGEEAAALTRTLGMSGESFERFRLAIEKGDEGVIDDFLETFKEAQSTTIGSLGRSLVLGGQEVRDAFGISAETMVFGAARAGKDEAEAREEATSAIEKAMKEEFDAIISGRAALTEAEITAAVALDQVLYPAAEILSFGFIGLNNVVNELTLSFDKLLGLIPGYESKSELQGDIASEQENIEKARQKLAELEQDDSLFSQTRRNMAQSSIDTSLDRQATQAATLIEKGGTVDEEVLTQVIERVKKQLDDSERIAERIEMGQFLSSDDRRHQLTYGTLEEVQQRLTTLTQAQTSSAPVGPADVSTARLPDDTAITTPSARELRVAAEREDSNRRIQLSGEGYSRSEIDAMMASNAGAQSVANSESTPTARPLEETPNEIADLATSEVSTTPVSVAATVSDAAPELPNELATPTTPEAPAVTQTAPRTLAPAIETPTPAQVTAAITPTPVAQPTQPTTPVITTTTAQANNANANNDINDIMSLLSYKLDTVIDLLGAGVTIQDRILLESRS